MRFIHFYVIAYFVLLAAAGIVLWQSGVLGRISPLWLAAAGLVAVGLGLALALTSIKRTPV